jgi:hypothetical protein
MYVQRSSCDEEQEIPNSESTISLLQVKISDGDIGGFVGAFIEVRGLSGNLKFSGEILVFGAQ